MADLVILGTGEFGRLARRYFESESSYTVAAFALDRAYLDDQDAFEGLPIVPFDALERDYPPTEVELFVAVGYRQVNRARAGAYFRAKSAGYRLATFVSPRAIVDSDLIVGDNCFIFEGVIIQPFVRIGSDTIIWSGACIAHDSTIGDHCFIAPRASISGNVTIADFAFIGNNATVRDGVAIGSATVVGAGALIKRDTTAADVYAPTPTTASETKKSHDFDNL